MKLISGILAALTAIAVLSSNAEAATSTWTAGYPKAGTNAGEIDVSGTFTPDAGQPIGAGAAAAAWKVGSGVVKNKTITINTTTGAWSGTITGLTSGTQYNVVVQTKQGTGMNTATIATDPGTATAK